MKNLDFTGSARETRTPPVRIARAPGRPFLRFDRSLIEQSIPARFHRQALDYPERSAVRSREGTLSYSELDEVSDCIADLLVERRGAGTEPVALLLPQGMLSVAAILGVLKAGKFYISLEPTAPRESLRGIRAESGAHVLLTDAGRSELAQEIGSGMTILIDLDDLDTVPPPRPVPDPPSADSLAYIFFTSGTTGRPKGVVDTHRNVLHNVMRYTNSLEVGCNDRLTLLQSPSFSGSVSSLFAALLNGACVYPIDLQNESLTELAEWLQTEKITIYHSVPALFRSVFADGFYPHVRVIRLEGDQASLRDVELLHERFAPSCVLVNGLGTTETGLVCQYFMDRQSVLEGSVVPVGYPVEDVEVELFDTQNGVGEIAVRSRYLAKGYWNQPEQTSRVFLQDPEQRGQRTYRTGDVGRFAADGCLEHLGRLDSRVKIRGHWVELADVEGALLASAELREAAVAVLDHENGGRTLVAHVVPEPGSRPTASALRRAISERLDRHMIPARFVFLDRLPLSPNGKVDRSALPAPGLDRPPLDTAFVGAGTPLAHSLTEIWEDVLRVRPIGVRDDFFDLGGDSLLAAEMICHIEARFGQPLDASAMLRRATIENLAASMTSGDHELRGPVVTLNPNGTREPLFFLHGDYVSEGFYGLDLARHLGADQPLSLLAPCGVDGRSIPRSFGAMAERHLEALRAVRPEGPYRIGGRCNGALVAYEMARKLVAEGQTVELLLLCYASAEGLRYQPLRTAFERFGDVARWSPEKRLEYVLRVRQFLRALRGLPPWRWPVRVLGKGVKLIGEIMVDQIARLGTRSSDPAVDLDPGPRTARGPRERIIHLYHQLDDEWIPEPYPGAITLIWPEEDLQPAEAAARLWRRLVPEVELCTVPGDYDDFATRSVRQLADAIAVSLARADASAQPRR